MEKKTTKHWTNVPFEWEKKRAKNYFIVEKCSHAKHVKWRWQNGTADDTFFSAFEKICIKFQLQYLNQTLTSIRRYATPYEWMMLSLFLSMVYLKIAPKFASMKSETMKPNCSCLQFVWSRFFLHTTRNWISREWVSREWESKPQ